MPVMPEGLYVSVSQIKTWLMCPKKYFFKYVLGEPSAFVPVALVFGSAFHAALAAFYTEVKTSGAALALDHMADVFRDAWSRGTSGPVPLQGDDEDGLDIGEIADHGVRMLSVFHAHANGGLDRLQVEKVEMGFAVAIHDPETGEVLDEQLVGTVDLVVREDDHRVVIEHKTSAKKFSQDQLLFDQQLTAYQFATRQLGLGDVALRYQIITKAKVPAVQVADVRRDDGDEEDFLRTAVGVLRAIDAGVSYPVRGWGCRTCPFQSRCSSRGGAS